MKKLITLTMLTLGLLCAGSAFAEVKLHVDDNIKVVAINGQEVKHGLLQPLQREFTLTKGRHVITARYDRLFDLNREHDYVKSGNVTITANLDDGQYELIMPNQPTSYHSAKEYAKNPSLAITQQGKVLTQEDISEERGGILSGLNLGSLFHRSGVASNQKAIASLDTTNTQAQPTTPPNTVNTTDDNLDGFMKIWLNSSETEREKIRQWIEK